MNSVNIKNNKEDKNMEITDLPAYKRLEEMFRQKGYSQGIKINMQIPNAYKDSRRELPRVC